MKRFEEKGLELMDQKGSLNFIIESNCTSAKASLGRNDTWLPKHLDPHCRTRLPTSNLLASGRIRRISTTHTRPDPRSIKDPRTTTNRKFNRRLGSQEPRRVGSSFPASNLQGSHFSLASQTSSRRSRSAGVSPVQFHPFPC